MSTLCEKVSRHLTDQKRNALKDRHEYEIPTEFSRIVESRAGDWLHHGKHSLQLGLMQITRAVAQPTTF